MQPSLLDKPFALDPATEMGPVTPELLQPGSGVNQAEMGVPPGFQSGKMDLGGILNTIAEGISQSGLTPEEMRGPLMQHFAQKREATRQERASKQLQFVTGHLSEAFASGDADRITKAIKEVSKLENMEPEVGKVYNQLSASFSEQLGKIANARDEQKKQSQAVSDALEAASMGASRIEIAQLLARRGVDVKAIDDISKLIPEPTKPTAGALATRPLKDKVVSAMSIPAGALVPPELAADLANFGIDASDKEQLKKVQKELAEPTLGVQLANLGLSRERFERIPPQDRRMLSESRASFNQLDKISQLYQQTDAFKTGKISSILKAGIATNQTARALSEMGLLPTGKLTGAELDFSNAYNALLIKLRSFSGDPRFSDQDALRTIQGLGSGLIGKNFPRQLAAAQDFVAEIYGTTLEDLSATGFDTSKIRGLERSLTKEEAAKVVVEAGGDRNKARELAKKRGFKF